jgi:hypothetical protein
MWSSVPLCLGWLLWRERNRRAFEDSEKSLVDLKLILLRALCDGWLLYQAIRALLFLILSILVILVNLFLVFLFF